MVDNIYVHSIPSIVDREKTAVSFGSSNSTSTYGCFEPFRRINADRLERGVTFKHIAYHTKVLDVVEWINNTFKNISIELTNITECNTIKVTIRPDKFSYNDNHSCILGNYTNTFNTDTYIHLPATYCGFKVNIKTSKNFTSMPYYFVHHILRLFSYGELPIRSILNTYKNASRYIEISDRLSNMDILESINTLNNLASVDRRLYYRDVSYDILNWLFDERYNIFFNECGKNGQTNFITELRNYLENPTVRYRYGRYTIGFAVREDHRYDYRGNDISRTGTLTDWIGKYKVLVRFGDYMYTTSRLSYNLIDLRTGEKLKHREHNISDAGTLVCIETAKEAKFIRLGIEFEKEIV